MDMAEDREVDGIGQHVPCVREVVGDHFGIGRARVPSALELEMSEDHAEVRLLQLLRAAVDPFPPEPSGDLVGFLPGDLPADGGPDALHDLLGMQVGHEDEPDRATADGSRLDPWLPKHANVFVSPEVVQGGGLGSPARLVVVAREDPHLDAGLAKGLDHIAPDEFAKDRGDVGPFEQIPEDAEEGRPELDRPPSCHREIPVEVHRPLRDSGLGVDAEVEVLPLMNIGHADDFVHPRGRNGDPPTYRLYQKVSESI